MQVQTPMQVYYTLISFVHVGGQLQSCTFSYVNINCTYRAVPSGGGGGGGGQLNISSSCSSKNFRQESEVQRIADLSLLVLLTVSILIKGSYIEAFRTGFQPLPFVRSRERGKLGTGLYALILGSVLTYNFFNLAGLMCTTRRTWSLKTSL